MRHLNESEKSVSDLLFSPADLAELVKMSTDGVVSKNAAKDILKIMDKFYIEYLNEIKLTLLLDSNKISKYRKVYIFAELMRCEDDQRNTELESNNRLLANKIKELRKEIKEYEKLLKK